MDVVVIALGLGGVLCAEASDLAQGQKEELSVLNPMEGVLNADCVVR